jgi:hypothetical protein
MQSLWSALIGSAVAVFGFLVQESWRYYARRREELEKLRLAKKVEQLGRQLAEFYWPIYLRLQKDNAVWERILDKRKPEGSLDHKLGEIIEREHVLPNQEEIVRIIESSVHLAEPDPEFAAILVRFLRHVAVYKALRASGDTNTFPLTVGEPWPERLFPEIEKRTRAVQEEYNRLLRLDHRPGVSPWSAQSRTSELKVRR